MSGDRMNFPEKPHDFLKSFSFVDSEQVYTNGAELIPVFRVEQMLEHYFHQNTCSESKGPTELQLMRAEIDVIKKVVAAQTAALTDFAKCARDLLDLYSAMQRRDK